jgi:hypothetical protein
MTKYGDVITSTATDPSGNTSEFSQAIGGLQNQILASSNIPFHYKINQESVRIIDNATICKQIQSAFGNWSGIATSSMSFIYDGTTASKYASASDNINLVSFKDDKFPFSPGILAVTAKTLKIGATDAEAQIIDADIVFNPYYVNNSTYNLGSLTIHYMQDSSISRVLQRMKSDMFLDYCIQVCIMQPCGLKSEWVSIQEALSRMINRG